MDWLGHPSQLSAIPLTNQHLDCRPRNGEGEYAWSDSVPTQCSFASTGTSDWTSGCVTEGGNISAVISSC